jgi:hypothetical protein
MLACRVLDNDGSSCLYSEPSFDLDANPELVKFFGLEDVKDSDNVLVSIDVDKIFEAIQNAKQLNLCPCVVDSLIEDVRHATIHESRLYYCVKYCIYLF